MVGYYSSRNPIHTVSEETVKKMFEDLVIKDPSLCHNLYLQCRSVYYKTNSTLELDVTKPLNRIKAPLS